MGHNINEKKPAVQKSPKKRVLSWVALVCASTAIAFAFHYWFGDSGSKDRSFQGKRVVRKEIAEQSIPTSSPRADFNYAVRQGTAATNPPANALSETDARQPSPRLVDNQRASTRRRTEHPIEQTEKSSDLEAHSKKPEYSDAEPPTLLSISFEPKKAPPGTNVVVYIEASDNLSGVHAVSGRAKSPSGTAVVPFGCQKADDKESFVGVIEIPDRAETGSWSVASLRMTDRVQNSKTYTENDLVVRTAGFEVVGTGSDNSPPTVVDVRLDPYEVRGGEKVRLVVEAEDGQSGVARIHGSLISPSNNARFSIACRKTGEDNVFAGHTTLPKDAESGEWSLYYIRAEDEAKNTKMYYRNNYPELFEQATIRVYGESSDALPPTLDDLAVSPTAVAYGEPVEIVVSAADDVSGISRVQGRLRSPSGKAHISFSCNHQGGSDTYRAKVTIKNNSEVGIWTVDHIRMVDKARNHKVYGREDPLVAEATFEVTGEP
jgi:hypothetical protein